MISFTSSTIGKCGIQRLLALIGSARTHSFRKPLIYQPQAACIMSVARVTAHRNPSVTAKALFSPLEPLTAHQKLRYLSVHFRTDGRHADTVFTFPVVDGADPMAALKDYIPSMGCEIGCEYVDAFQRYVKRLHVDEIPLLASTQTMDRGTTGKQPKFSAPDITMPGKYRDEEIELRLRQGLSFFDMETTFQKTAVFIAREAERILGKYELQVVLSRNKRGKWSDYEIQQLVGLREQGLSVTKLATWLRRPTEAVRKHLQGLESTLVAPSVVHGPQELPPGFRDSLFTARLEAVWQALLRSDMAQTWKETLERSNEGWLSKISRLIPESVKKLLGGLRPPTWDDLESLPSIDTTDAGVYARLSTSRHSFHMASDRYLYVGSATRYGGGLNWRIYQHTRKNTRKWESRLQYDIRTKRLKSSFVTLMVMKMDHSNPEAVLEVRRTVVLAEAIFTVWLGALERPPHDLQNMCPWDLRTLQWTGWSSHNPLLDDVTLPSNHNIPRAGEPQS